MSLSEWDTGSSAEINLSAMDALVKEYKEKRDQYDELKRQASEAWKLVEDVQNKIMKALEAAGKKSYKVDGVGTFSMVTKQVVGMPKTIEGKEKLFNYLRETYGEDLVLSLQTINWQSLNGFYNEEAAKSDDPAFLFPGMDAPTTRTEPRFTSAK